MTPKSEVLDIAHRFSCHVNRGGSLMLVAFFAMLLPSCAQGKSVISSAVTGSWPMYQAVPSHNAVLNVQAPPHWSFNAGGQINGGLAIVGKRVFLDTLAGDVFALDLGTGRPLWSRRFDNDVMSTPIVVNDLVIVGTGRNPTAHDRDNAFAYDPNTAANRSGFWGRIGGDNIVALDARTGQMRWHYRTSGEDMPSPAVVQGALVFANGDSHAYELSTSGIARWRQRVHGIATMASAISVNDGTVVVSVCSDAMAHGATIALNVAGKLLWRAPHGNCDSSPTYADGRVFVSGVINDDARSRYGWTTVAALDARNGRVSWFYRTHHPGLYTTVGSSERAIAGTYADGRYFQPAVTSDEILAFDASTGHVRWRLHTKAPVKMSPVVDRGRVYFGDTGGVFYKVRERDGIVEWTHRFPKPFTTSPPVLIGRSVLCADGSTLALFAP
jgi:outer membrane protein assembly factor BamB